MKFLKCSLMLTLCVCLIIPMGCANTPASADTSLDATPEVTAAPTAEPTAEPTVEPTVEPTPEPVPENSIGFVGDDGANKIPYTEGMEIGGAAAWERVFDHEDSPYFPSLDYYHMASNETLTLIENFKTYQQTTDWSCGTACALMVLEHYGMAEGHDDVTLKDFRNKDEPGATSVAQLEAVYKHFGMQTDTTANYKLEDITLELLYSYLDKGIPVAMESNEWGGHWQVLIGYDTMGTDSIADDVLILADPFDTSDHWQDGYYTVDGERFYYMWTDGHIFPEGERDRLFVAAWPAE